VRVRVRVRVCVN